MQTEEALRDSKELFSMFIDYLPEIVFIKDEKSTTLYVNEHMNHVLGAKQWIGKTPIDLFPKDLADKMISDDKKTLDEAHRIIIETVPNKNGNDRIFQTHKFRINRSGKTPLIGGIALDITELRQAEEGREKIVKALQGSLEGVRTMSGLIPICAQCKKIRDNKGCWKIMEEYIQKNSYAKFSHSMCPECSEKIYGDEDWYLNTKKKRL